MLGLTDSMVLQVAWLRLSVRFPSDLISVSTRLEGRFSCEGGRGSGLVFRSDSAGIPGEGKTTRPRAGWEA